MNGLLYGHLCYITVLDCDSASLRIMSDNLNTKVELVLLCVLHILGLDKEIIAHGIIWDLKCFNIFIMEHNDLLCILEMTLRSRG